MKHAYSVYIFSLMLAAGAGAQESPLLAYQWQGGRSLYSQIGVVIMQTGEAKVSWQGIKQLPFEYHTTLSAEEIATVHALIRSTDFFAQSGENPVFFPMLVKQKSLSKVAAKAKPSNTSICQRWHPWRG